MQRIGLVPFCLWGICALAFAQAPDTAWTRAFTGPENDWVNGIAAAPDGGCVIAGKSYTLGGFAYLVRFSALGETIWERIYEDFEDAKAIVSATDNGYVFCADRVFAPGLHGPALVKINTNGGIVWVRDLVMENIHVVDVCPSQDGGYAAVAFGGGGQIGRQISVERVSSTGDSLWSRSWCTGTLYEAVALSQVADGGFVAAARAGDPFDFFVLRLSETGDSLWSSSIGGPYTDFAADICASPDGGAVICGTYVNADGTGDAYLIKYSASGDTVWSRLLADETGRAAWSIIPIAEGGYAFVGVDYSFSPSDADIWLVRITENGEIMWSGRYGTAQIEQCYALTRTTEGAYAMAAWSIAPDWNWDIYVVCTRPDTLAAQGNPQPLPSSVSLLQSYPNPFNSSTQLRFELLRPSRVELSIVNTLGQHVAMLTDEDYAAGTYVVSWDASGFASGIYFAQLRSGSQNRVLKMVLVK